MKKIILVFVFVLFLSACSSNSPKDNDPVDETPQDEEPIVEISNRSIFNGQEIDEEQNTYQAFGIMI